MKAASRKLKISHSPTSIKLIQHCSTVRWLVSVMVCMLVFMTVMDSDEIGGHAFLPMKDDVFGSGQALLADLMEEWPKCKDLRSLGADEAWQAWCIADKW